MSGIICKTRSRGGNEIGAITSLNEENGIVENSKTERNVMLSGDASIIGGLVGANEGTVRMVESSIIPKIDSSKSNLTVGGAVGENRKNANVTAVQVKVGEVTDSSALIGFKDYQYLGGIVGQNSGHDEREQTLNQLLVEMDGFGVNEGIIVMARLGMGICQYQPESVFYKMVIET